MRQYVILISLLLSMILISCSSSKGLSKEDKAAKETALKEAIEKREFHIDVDRMNPMSGKTQHLTSSYSLDIDGDKVKSYLPFFGKAYSIPYGGGKGLIFESAITDYESSYDSKGKAIINFKTKTDEDTYNFRVEIFPNGSTSINVFSVNRQAISFSGTASERKSSQEMS
jgi:hypothetical protein